MATKTAQRAPASGGNASNNRVVTPAVANVKTRTAPATPTYRAGRTVRAANGANGSSGQKTTEKLRVTVFKAVGEGNPDEQGKAIIVPDTWSDFIKVKVTVQNSNSQMLLFYCSRCSVLPGRQ